jgi:NhaP-type Na+/H+ or K+/H+ antiporter
MMQDDGKADPEPAITISDVKTNIEPSDGNSSETEAKEGAHSSETHATEKTTESVNELVGDALEPSSGTTHAEEGGAGTATEHEETEHRHEETDGHHDSETHGNHDSKTEHHHQHSRGFLALLFFFGALSSGCVLQLILDRFIPNVPYTCGLFALGMFSEVVAFHTPPDSRFFWNDWYTAVDMWEKIDPHLLFFAFLPPLLFSEAMRLNVKLATTCLPQVLLLACPGVLFGTFATGAVAKYLMPYEWDWPICLVFGAILSATDPVAVVALFNTLGVSPKLTMVISGESLLNDGTAIVVFSLMLKVLLGASLTLTSVSYFFARMVCVSLVVGVGVSVLALVVIDYCAERHRHTDAMIQVIATICCAYLAFFISEAEAGASGVLGTVSAGSALAYYAWPRFASREIVEIVWEAIEFIGNTVIFFLAGMLFMNVTIDRHEYIRLRDFFWLLALYVILHFLRAAMVAILWKPLNMVGRPLEWKEGIVMVWSGLRGAVSLTMAIIVDIEPAVSKQMGTRVLFHVGGIAALTCVINATSSAPLLKKLGISKASSMKERMLSEFAKHLSRDVLAAFDKFLSSDDVRFNGADRSIVCKMVPVLNNVDDGRRSIGGKDLLGQCRKKKVPTPKAPAASGCTEEELNSLAQTYREVFLHVVQCRYWESIDEGVIPRNLKATRVLLQSVDEALEKTNDVLADWAAIERDVSIQPIKNTLQRRLADLSDQIFSFVATFRRGDTSAEDTNAFATMQLVYSALVFIDAHCHAMELIPKYFASKDGAPTSPGVGKNPGALRFDSATDKYIQDTIVKESMEQCNLAISLLESVDKGLVELGRSEMLARRLLIFQIKEVGEMKEKGLLTANEAAHFEHDLNEAQRKLNYGSKSEWLPSASH